MPEASIFWNDCSFKADIIETLTSVNTDNSRAVPANIVIQPYSRNQLTFRLAKLPKQEYLLVLFLSILTPSAH
ncbi:hypothetical protein Y032_0050g1950 [Ancylostoma ceylanicum]|uniref:Uncharacterized protein n=1 Tax=Ancylostoma ceylanicum TaxID=53326 RepID=A0A016U9I5_9BILA|nr:hypothetical protein Y032_0050g1950 [Ancylostoma ceylanicum]